MLALNLMATQPPVGTQTVLISRDTDVVDQRRVHEVKRRGIGRFEVVGTISYHVKAIAIQVYGMVLLGGHQACPLEHNLHNQEKESAELGLPIYVLLQ